MATSFRAGGASGLLQPRDESLKGESLGERASTTGSRRSSRCNRCGADSIVLNGGRRRSGRCGRRCGRSSGVTRAGASARASAGAREESGARHLVVRVIAVHVDLDTGVGRGIELVGGHTLGVLCTRASDLQVEA